MKKIFNSENIQLNLELNRNNSVNNIFGKLEFLIDGRNLSNSEENNLSYFYVDCESLKLMLEGNSKIENDLFLIQNQEILSLWQEWRNYNSGSSTEEDETENVQFFDRNFFKTGNPFKSYFFDEIMIFYVIEDRLIKFKYWNKLDPSTVFNIQTSKEHLIECLESFMSFFTLAVSDLQK